MISIAPQEINETNWYYEDRDGIDLIHEVYTRDVCLRTDHIKIPWKMLRASLARLDHKRKQRSKP